MLQNILFSVLLIFNLKFSKLCCNFKLQNGVKRVTLLGGNTEIDQKTAGGENLKVVWAEFSGNF